MLISLDIKNYALIEELHVEFEKGLNIITGETGTGKSIIIDALSLILGERADNDAVRKGADKAIVEATFDVKNDKHLKRLLEENEVEFSDEMLLRREISSKGQSRCFINDTPIPLGLLKKVGDRLVDLHGQHEHQSLLRSETHIELLDEYADTEKLVEEFHSAYRQILQLFGEKHELQSREQQVKERRELSEFQLKEIESLNPQPGEEERLESELTILENAEKLCTTAEQVYHLLYEGDSAIHDRLAVVRNHLEALAKIDKHFSELLNEASSALAIVNELSKSIKNYRERIEFNPIRLEELRNRLGQLTMLKKKYGGSLDAVIAHAEKIKQEIALAENFEGERAKLEEKIEAQRKVCSDLAQQLSSTRNQAARSVAKDVEQALVRLGIASPKFEARISQHPLSQTQEGIVKLNKTWYETTNSGIDIVEFYLSTNVGEDVKPLVKVASGGEISRIMLALKMILSTKARLPLLIFDEIDVGVSGRIAQAVGKSLHQLAQRHQIIAITHLPQIAGFADTHYSVEKIEDGKRTFTQLRKLSAEERVKEIARLMSGEKVTEASLRSARELIAK
jgi:DNA repair protein RecN (Recombination protein N)